MSIHERRWYSEEATRIIAEADKDRLYEILRVRDAACALFAVRTLQTSDAFTDSAVVEYLDKEIKQPWNPLGKALERIVSDFEMDFVIDGVLVDEPYPTHKTAWKIARAALALADKEQP